MAVLLMIASTFSVALIADSAAAAGSYRVKLNVSDSRPDVGETRAALRQGHAGRTGQAGARAGQGRGHRLGDDLADQV